jgi:uncharacterized protein
MDVENAIRTFANAGSDLPREAMRWVLDNWDDAAPGLLGVLERFADGTDRSEEAANAVSFILHLASERQERRVFAPLCRLAKDAEAVEAVMGDSATTTLKQIMISTYDDDLDTLKGVIEAAETDEFVRTGALEVLAYLMATERVAREEAEAYLLQLSVVALLGSQPWSGVVQQAFARGLISPMDMNHDNFREDLRRVLTDPERMADFKHANIAAFNNALGELSPRHTSSGAAKGDQERRVVGREGAGLTPAAALQPSANMSKGVGRNDPCPCGSGKKFKKCCLQ